MSVAGAGVSRLAAGPGVPPGAPRVSRSITGGEAGSAAARPLVLRRAAGTVTCAAKSSAPSSAARLAGGLGRGMGTSWAGQPRGLARGRCGDSGRLLQRLHGLEHFLDVAGNREAAPLGAQHAGRVDQEGAALDALHLLAVHDLVLDDA